MPRKPFPWRMGADPEFTILLDGKKCDAHAVFSHFRHPDAESCQQGFQSPGMKGNIGWDGCTSTAEIRPDPADTADGLVENIRSLLEPTLSKLPAFDFSTLSVFAPIGGHIHFDLPDDATNTLADKLNKQLSSFYLPIMLSENAVSTAIRQRSYGKLGDHREEHEFQVEGKRVRTFEFRTPSAEWLTTPKVATAVLAYLATIWHECRNNGANVAKWKDIVIKTEKQMEALQTIASSNYAILTAVLLTQIRRAVRTFEFYPVYKKEIDWLLQPKNVLKEKSRVNFDMAIGWGFRAKKEVTKKDFLTKKNIEKANKENGLSLDFCATNIVLPFNDDFNVKPFAVALAERMAAFGWKPKYNYYFFGLKKGTDKMLVSDETNRMAFGNHIFQSEENKSLATDAVQRMRIRANERYADRTPLTVDSKTGRLSRPKKPAILFGLPHGVREKLQIKSILEAVWKIEKGEAVFEAATVELPKDHAPEQAIELAETEQVDLMDSSSQGASYAAMAIHELARNNGGTSVLEREPEEVIPGESFYDRIRREWVYGRFDSNCGRGMGWSPLDHAGRAFVIVDLEHSPDQEHLDLPARRQLDSFDRDALNIPGDTNPVLFISSFNATT